MSCKYCTPERQARFRKEFIERKNKHIDTLKDRFENLDPVIYTLEGLDDRTYLLDKYHDIQTRTHDPINFDDPEIYSLLWDLSSGLMGLIVYR
jgi:hypothetical protein